MASLTESALNLTKDGDKVNKLNGKTSFFLKKKKNLSFVTNGVRYIVDLFFSLALYISSIA